MQYIFFSVMDWSVRIQHQVIGRGDMSLTFYYVVEHLDTFLNKISSFFKVDNPWHVGELRNLQSNIWSKEVPKTGEKRIEKNRKKEEVGGLTLESHREERSRW